MSKKRLIVIVSTICVAVIAVVMLPMAQASSCHPDHKKSKMDMKNPVKVETLSLEKIHSGHLPMVSQSINKAIKAIEAGNKETALAELHKAKKMIAGINEAIGKHIKPKFVNSKCPIWGAPIEPDKVTKDLVREYKGQKVAFCCKECPPEWDKLTDAEKDAKLAKTKPAEGHSEHKMY